jgi:hypothetical protein
MLKHPCLAAVLLLAAWLGPLRAQAEYTFSLSDLAAIFVQNQQYFILDDEGFGDPSLNHLHFTKIDTTTGDFTGAIWAPVVAPAIPQMTLPVTGKLTIHPDVGDFGFSAGTGNYYEISFSWQYTPACEVQQATYTGGITFRGYVGGKMRATIAGTTDVVRGSCLIGSFPFAPQPFSGILVK